MSKRYEEYLSASKTAWVNGKHYEAEMLCKKALEIKPTSEAFYYLGNYYMTAKRIELAIDAYSKAIQHADDNGEAHFGLGSCYFIKEQYQLALDEFAKADQYGCSNKAKRKMYYYNGLINERLNNAKGALIYYDKALKVDESINSDIKNILLRQVDIYIRMRNYTSAEECALKLKMISPEEFKSYELIIQLFLSTGKIEEAKSVLEDAETYFKGDSKISICIGFNYVRLYYAMAFVKRDNALECYKNAYSCLTKVMAIKELTEEDRLTALFMLIDISKKMNDRESLIMAAKKLLEKSVDKDGKYVYRAKAELIEAYTEKKQYKDAMGLAIDLKSSKDDMYKCLGYYSEAFITKEMGKSIPDMRQKAIELYQRAIAFYRNCMVENPVNYSALIYRIKANVDIGNRKKAEELYQLLPEGMEDGKLVLKDYMESSDC